MHCNSRYVRTPIVYAPSLCMTTKSSIVPNVCTRDMQVLVCTVCSCVAVVFLFQTDQYTFVKHILTKFTRVANTRNRRHDARRVCCAYSQGNWAILHAASTVGARVPYLLYEQLNISISISLLRIPWLLSNGTSRNRYTHRVMLWYLKWYAGLFSALSQTQAYVHIDILPTLTTSRSAERHSHNTSGTTVSPRARKAHPF